MQVQPPWVHKPIYLSATNILGYLRAYSGSTSNTMSVPSNTALSVDADGIFSVRKDVDVPTAENGEMVVRVLYSGINPADTKHSSHLGIVDTVIGYDFCGEVVDAGTTSFSTGDIVAGMTPTGIGRPHRYGAHQEYLSCPEDMAWLVPDNLPRHHAAALSVVAATAADAVFNIFGLPLPGDDATKMEEDQRKGPILIWGGSSSVGICAIQLARAAGCREIFVTASPGRHELLRSLGASNCFDYASPNVVADIKATVEAQNGEIMYAIDAVGTPTSAKQVESCSGDSTILASTTQTFGKFQMPFATRSRAVKIRIPGLPQSIDFPAQPAQAARMDVTTKWVVHNYGDVFHLPKVEVFSGDAGECLAKVQETVDKGAFGKVVLQHPFKDSQCYTA
jgi:NADPH:quinone reductase-like Zn-dependent oxidoreductase